MGKRTGGEVGGLCLAFSPYGYHVHNCTWCSLETVLPSPEVKPPDFFLAQLPDTIKWSRASRDIPLPQTAYP